MTRPLSRVFRLIAPVAALLLLSSCWLDLRFTGSADIVSFSSEKSAGPIHTRWMTLSAVPSDYRDTRISAQMLGNRRELFGLSMADMFLCWQLSNELPLIATGYQISPNDKVRDFVNRQLSEMASWQRLNRPGWTLYLPGGPVPADYDDGNWLGTGFCIQAIVDTLRLMRPAIEPDVQERLHALLRAEVASVRDDFRLHRVWFWDYPVSNQFVLPSAGVLLAAIELGQKSGDDDYEFAVRNLLRYLDAQGEDGSHHEGLHYSTVSNQIVMYAALTTSGLGDTRLAAHRHIRNYPQWLIAMLQPGGTFVNTHDGPARKVDVSAPHVYKLGVPSEGVLYFDALLMAGMTTRDPEVNWIVDEVFKEPQATATGYRFHRFSQDFSRERQPATYSQFRTSPLVTWRSSWEANATGVWLRGSAADDSHEHRDAGHVSFLLNGAEVFVEAGSTDYAFPDFDKFFVSSLAHNVLELGEAAEGKQLKGAGSKLTVVHLDSAGGEVDMDQTSEYSATLLRRWVRNASWDQNALRLRDVVELTQGRKETVLFRFHLADSSPIAVVNTGAGCTQATLTWKNVQIDLSATACLAVNSASLPIGNTYRDHGLHTVLEIRTVDPVDKLTLTTRVSQARP